MRRLRRKPRRLALVQVIGPLSLPEATQPHGELADGLSELWLDAPREHARRTILDALSGLVLQPDFGDRGW